MTPLSPIQGECVVDIATAPNPQASILAGQGVVLRAEITEEFNAWALVTIIFQASQVAFASQKLLPISKQVEPLLWFRLSVRSGGQEVARPWEPHWLTYYQTLMLNDNSSATVLIQTADLLYKLNRGTKIANFSGTASSMASKIITANFPQNLTVASEASGTPLTLFQSHLTDWEFLRGRVQPRTLNGQNHGGYLLYQRADAAGKPRIIFGTPDFPDVQPTIWDVTQSPSSPVGKIMFSDRSRLNAAGLAGAAPLPEAPYVPPGTSVNASNANTAIKFSDTLATASPSETVLVPRHVGDVNPPDELTALAQNAYADERLDVYRAEFDVAQVPTIRLGDFLYVRSSDTVWNGAYVISRLFHEVMRGSLKTTVRGVRGESTSAGGTTTTAATSSPNSAAPGNNSSNSGGQAPRGLPTDDGTGTTGNEQYLPPGAPSFRVDGQPVDGPVTDTSDPNTLEPVTRGDSGVLDLKTFPKTPAVPYGSGDPNAPYTPDPLPTP